MAAERINEIVDILLKTGRLIIDQRSRMTPEQRSASQFADDETGIVMDTANSAKEIRRTYDRCVEDCGPSFEQFDDTIRIKMGNVLQRLMMIREAVEKAMTRGWMFLTAATVRRTANEQCAGALKALTDWRHRLLEQSPTGGPSASTSSIQAGPASPPREVYRRAVENAKARSQERDAARQASRSLSASSDPDQRRSTGGPSSSQTPQLASKVSHASISRGRAEEEPSIRGRRGRSRSRSSLSQRLASRSPSLAAVARGIKRLSFRRPKTPAATEQPSESTSPVTHRTSASTSSAGKQKQRKEHSPDPAVTDQPSASTSSAGKQKQRKVDSPEHGPSFPGLCPGAIRLHGTNGARKDLLDIHTRGDGTLFVECPEENCTFQGPHIGKSKRVPIVDHEIFHAECPGIHFRWIFLAKSHVPCSTVDTGEGFDPFAQVFNCVFCGDGFEPGQRLQGANAYIWHISEYHAMHLDADQLRKWNVLDNQGGTPQDPFDLNIAWIR